MKLNEIKPKAGSVKTRMRVGRGIGSGKGKTCGVGVKGQKARSGVAIKGFEGGQMPLYMRLPKVGFSNKKFGVLLAEVTLGKIQDAIDGKKLDAKKQIDEAALLAAGVVSAKRDGIKLLSKGVLTSKVDLKLTKASKTAQAAVEKVGGTVEIVVRVVAPVKKRGEKKKA
jgi:large subunit ribosomal protein L15